MSAKEIHVYLKDKDWPIRGRSCREEGSFLSLEHDNGVVTKVPIGLVRKIEEFPERP